MVKFDMRFYVPDLWRKFEFGLWMIQSEDQGKFGYVINEIHL